MTYEQKHNLMKLHFDKVKNKDNWKDPIDSIVTVESSDELNAIIDAVSYFTGSVADVIKIKENTFHVLADGYYLSVGA